MSVLDYYRILQLPRDADEVQIKKSYRALSLKYHPDKNMHNEEFYTKKFQQIQKAYSVLIDPMNRLFNDVGKSNDSIINNYKDMVNEWRVYTRTHDHYHEKHRKFNYHQNLDPDNPFKHEEKIFLYNKLNTTWFDGYSDEPCGFYTLCRKLFEKLTLELYKPKDVPTFGYSNSKFETTVYNFYKYWTSFYIEAPDHKDQYAANCRSTEVQNFVAYIRSIDERIIKEFKFRDKTVTNINKSKFTKNEQKSKRASVSSRLNYGKYKGDCASALLEDCDEYYNDEDYEEDEEYTERNEV